MLTNQGRCEGNGGSAHDPPALPRWVLDEFACVPPRRSSPGVREPSSSVEVQETPRSSLVTVRVPNMSECEAAVLQGRTLEAYREIARVLDGLSARHPIRFWNFIPRIGAGAGGGLDRYMVFNSARFAVFQEWYDDPAAFDRNVATSTGVGHAGSDLVIHVLCAERPGIQVMNPRQVRPRCYSRRYGPVPPCFARATLLAGARRGDWLVLVGGTSAVRGERSVGAKDALAQTEETFRNLEALLRAARSRATEAGGGTTGTEADRPEELWRCFRSLRVYHSRPDDEAVLRPMIEARFAHLDDVEFVRSDICRRELLVEIEGTAVLPTESD